MKPRLGWLLLVGLCLLAGRNAARAQSLDLGGAPGQPAVPIRITASQGITLEQANHVVIATGNATAVRGAVSVTADSLVAHYRPKPGVSPPGAAPARAPAPASAASNALSSLDTGSSQIYELDAIGHVHIFTATDNAYGDHAVYLADRNLLTLTGAHLKLTTPTDTITARDSIQYYTLDHKAVANGEAVAASNDGRSVTADQLTAWLAPASPTAGKQASSAAAPAGNGQPAESRLKRVDAVGNVIVRTPTEVAFGDRGDYEPADGIAHLYGHVRITRGVNEMMGASAIIHTKTGVATLLAGQGGQVSGTVVPNSAPGTPQ